MFTIMKKEGTRQNLRVLKLYFFLWPVSSGTLKPLLKRGPNPNPIQAQVLPIITPSSLSWISGVHGR